MTVIVGIQCEDAAWIGCDSLYTLSNGIKLTTDDRKVFQPCPRVLIGGCGSPRAFDVLKTGLKQFTPGKIKDPWDIAHRVTSIYRQSLIEHGALEKDEDGTDDASPLLMAIDKKLWVVGTAFDMMSVSVDGYVALGSGKEVALGSLHTTYYLSWSPQVRIIESLEASGHHMMHVGPPYLCFKQGEDGKAVEVPETP